MTDKCRGMMNGREGYITTEITQSGKEGQEGPEKGERLLGCEGNWEFPSSGKAPFSPWDVGLSGFVYFSPAK